MKQQELLEKIVHSRCAVLGFGISNRPLVRFLLENGAVAITVHDRKSVEELGSAATEFAARGVNFVTGEDYLEDVDADVIFRSPGIRDDKGGIPSALSRGAFLTSEMELFLALTDARVLAVTGSDGKTTTTTLISEFLKKEYGDSRVYIGGNIGEPLLPHVREMTEKDFAVVELSSFQLKTMRQSPWRAVITNVSPNHLDWHTGMEEYIAAKRNICAYPENTLLVTNAGNATTADIALHHVGNVTLFSARMSGFLPIAGRIGQRAIYEKDGTIFSDDGKEPEEILKTADIKLIGRHNVENYMAAIGATEGLVSRESIRAIAKTFGGVEHRLEFVREIDGVRYYNSSIDSSPTRTAAALSALPQKPIVICGGYDKHIPFDGLGVTLCERAKAVVLTGATAPLIREAIEKTGLPEPTVVYESDFTAAVERSRRLAVAGDLVVLSPACASFDAFANFEERGRKFKQIVNAME